MENSGTNRRHSVISVQFYKCGEEKENTIKAYWWLFHSLYIVQWLYSRGRKWRYCLNYKWRVEQREQEDCPPIVIVKDRKNQGSQKSLCRNSLCLNTSINYSNFQKLYEHKKPSKKLCNINGTTDSDSSTLILVSQSKQEISINFRRAALNMFYAYTYLVNSGFLFCLCSTPLMFLMFRL